MQFIDETTLTTLRKAAAPQSYRLVDFETAEVRPGFVPNTFFLIVSGTVPCANMRVELIPVVYIKRPDYWEIEVVAFLPGPICLPQVGSTRKRFRSTAFWALPASRSSAQRAESVSAW